MGTLGRLIVAGLALLAAGSAQAQDMFPTKPVRILVGFAPGSGTDVLAREIARKLQADWGVGVVVDNRAGAGGIIATEILAHSLPDGYTLILLTVGHTFNASYYSKLPYDTQKDFAGVTVVADIPNALLVSPKSGINSMRALIELAKSKPGQLNYASAGIGSAMYISAEIFSNAAGIKVLHVPYKGAPQGMMATLEGSTHFAWPSITSATPVVKAKTLNALAVSSKERSSALPDVPSISEAGLPGVEVNCWYGLFVPAKTPIATKRKISQDVARVLALPDVREFFSALGAITRPTTPEEFDGYIKVDLARMATLIKEAGIHAE